MYEKALLYAHPVFVVVHVVGDGGPLGAVLLRGLLASRGLVVLGRHLAAGGD